MITIHIFFIRTSKFWLNPQGRDRIQHECRKVRLKLYCERLINYYKYILLNLLKMFLNLQTEKSKYKEDFTYTTEEPLGLGLV